jgi:hypothetical protein
MTNGRGEFLPVQMFGKYCILLRVWDILGRILFSFWKLSFKENNKI